MKASDYITPRTMSKSAWIVRFFGRINKKLSVMVRDRKWKDIEKKKQEWFSLDVHMYI